MIVICVVRHSGASRLGTLKYNFMEVQLEHVFEEKDLGIIIDTDLIFDVHVSKKIKKANTSKILRTFTTRDSITMMTLFKSLVLPRLDYGSQLWSPHLVKHIDKLEKIQRSFTKHITGMQS